MSIPAPLVLTGAALLGLFVGSFLTVATWRVPRRMSLLVPRSGCSTCRHPLGWWENIPLVSWLALRGRCHHCRARIGVRYPLLELACGLVGFVAAVVALH